VTFWNPNKNKSFSAESPLLDHTSRVESQNLLLSKLCPPSCLHSFFPPLDELNSLDSSTSPFIWIDDPFTITELDASIDSSKRKSSPGLDRIDYAIIRVLSPDLRTILLDIFNCTILNCTVKVSSSISGAHRCSPWSRSLMARVIVPLPSFFAFLRSLRE